MDCTKKFRPWRRFLRSCISVSNRTVLPRVAVASGRRPDDVHVLHAASGAVMVVAGVGVGPGAVIIPDPVVTLDATPAACSRGSLQ